MNLIAFASYGMATERVVMISMNNAFVRNFSLHEAIDALAQVYCPHSVKPKGLSRRLGAEVGVLQAGQQAAVHVRYSVPVTIDAGHFPDNLLIVMTAVSGAAKVTQNERSSSWRAGQKVAISPGQATTLEFDREFSQTSLRVNVDRLNTVCEQRLGHPLDVPLQFTLQPLSTCLERAWQNSMQLILTVGSTLGSLPHLATEPLDDFLLSLILYGHPHNYSEELARPMQAATPRLVMKAEQIFMDRAKSEVTVPEVAKELGVGVRSLQLGFRDSRQTTPSAFLLKVRLTAARRDLEGGKFNSVTDVALENGFTHLGRFSAAYRNEFGEPPLTTLRRCRRR